MLTKKQHELLMLINERLEQTGISPSYDEMKDALGLKSKSGIHRLITGLEERGFIRRLAHRARALEVLKMPGDVAASTPASGDMAGDVGGTGFDAKVIHGNFKSLPGAVPANEVESVELPLYGAIAAGNPIEALRDESNRVSVPASLLGRGEHYALEVDGDSMIEAGIFDGDTALIEHCDSAENGTIVVALIDDEEVTLKRVRRKGASIALEPANKDFETRIFGPDRVRVQGRIVGLMRKY
ncbi:MAG: transcriptional repressor LexA [Alphaproteobacteria bacterium]|nr:transcriptional repressor LexA [Alphaproteobacteria bacterium]